MKIESLKIGEKIYRCIPYVGVWEYVVEGIRRYDKEIQVEVKCIPCSHGWHCRLLLGEDDYGKIVHLKMLNDDEDDRQRCWHQNDGYHYFCSSREEAKKQNIDFLIKRAKEDVDNAKAVFANAEKRLLELRGMDK